MLSSNVHGDSQIYVGVDIYRLAGQPTRRAATSGDGRPQYIGAGKIFVVAPAESEPEQDREEPELTLDQWLVVNAPRGASLVVPDDEYPDDEILWTEEVDE